MPPHPPVGVHDDLATGQAGIAHRSAHDELARGIHVQLRVLEIGVVQIRRQHRPDDVLDQIGPHQRVDIDAVAMLAGQDHGGDELGLAVAIADRHLALRVGSEVGHDVSAPDLRRAVHQPVCQMDGQGHVHIGVAAGVAEHHALVAGSLAIELVLVARIGAHLEGLVHSLGDVAGLLVDGGDDPAGLGVEAVLGPGVADAGDGAAGDRRDIDVRAAW